MQRASLVWIQLYIQNNLKKGLEIYKPQDWWGSEIGFASGTVRSQSLALTIMLICCNFSHSAPPCLKEPDKRTHRKHLRSFTAELSSRAERCITKEPDSIRSGSLEFSKGFGGLALHCEAITKLVLRIEVSSLQNFVMVKSWEFKFSLPPMSVRTLVPEPQPAVSRHVGSRKAETGRKLWLEFRHCHRGGVHLTCLNSCAKCSSLHSF